MPVDRPKPFATLARRADVGARLVVPSLSRKAGHELMSAVAGLVEALGYDTRRELAVLEMRAAGQRAGATVSVDAAALLLLVRVHGEVIEQLQQEVSRLHSDVQASRQASLAV